MRLTSVRSHFQYNLQEAAIKNGSNGNGANTRASDSVVFGWQFPRMLEQVDQTQRLQQESTVKKIFVVAAKLEEVDAFSAPLLALPRSVSRWLHFRKVDCERHPQPRPFYRLTYPTSTGGYPGLLLAEEITNTSRGPYSLDHASHAAERIASVSLY